MALQDLTPQLRTRLGRLERLVGLFVAVAVALLLLGLAFYVYRLADRKGWFVRKLPFYTFVDSASGLHVGDPIRLMGFDAGEITEVKPQPPFDYFNVYVAFVIRQEHVGYLWDDSRAVVASSDLLGKRSIEVTKGTNGPPTYLFNEFHSVTLADAGSMLQSTNYFLAQTVYDSSGKVPLYRPYTALNRFTKERLEVLRSAGIESFLLLDKSTTTKWPSAVWDYKEGQYRPFHRKTDKGFFLPPREAPALAARLEKLADTVESSLPNVLGLTNRINRVLDQANLTAADADALLNDLRPLVSNLTRISANLTNGQGSLGEWLITPELQKQLTLTLEGAQSLVTNSNRRIDGLSTNVTSVLLNLASITSNLNAQVAANSNILTEISSAVTNADHLMQGLKRHWLLRSAFKEPKKAPPKSPGRAVAPKYSEPRR